MAKFNNSKNWGYAVTSGTALTSTSTNGWDWSGTTAVSSTGLPVSGFKVAPMPKKQPKPDGITYMSLHQMMTSRLQQAMKHILPGFYKLDFKLDNYSADNKTPYVGKVTLVLYSRFFFPMVLNGKPNAGDALNCVFEFEMVEKPLMDEKAFENFFVSICRTIERMVSLNGYFEEFEQAVAFSATEKYQSQQPELPGLQDEAVASSP